MSSDSKQQVPLEVTRGMLIAMVVVLGIGWFGGRSDRENGRGGRPGHAFGAWDTPQIASVTEPTARSVSIGLEIDAVPGFAFFLVDRPDDGLGPSTVSFINRKDLILGEIKAFDPAADTWPPSSDDFGQVVNLQTGPIETGPEQSGEQSDEQPSLRLGPPSDFRLQVQTILYGDTEIVWASPRKSPAWPLRIHRGKCELGSKTLLISVFEMQAQSADPDYTLGPIAVLAAALRPL